MELWSWLVSFTNFRSLGSIFASGLGNRVWKVTDFGLMMTQVRAVHPLQKPRDVPLGSSGWVKRKFLAVSRKEKYIPSLLYQGYWICNFEKYVRWGCGFATSILFWSRFRFSKKDLEQIPVCERINLLSLKAKYTSCSFIQCNYKRLGHFRFKFYFWGATKTGSCVSLHDGLHDIRIVSAAQLFRWSVSSPRQNNGERWSFCSKISLLLAWDSHYMFRNFLFSTSRQVLHVMSVQREAKQTLRVATFNVLAPCYNWLR